MNPTSSTSLKHPLFTGDLLQRIFVGGLAMSMAACGPKPESGGGSSTAPAGDASSAAPTASAPSASSSSAPVKPAPEPVEPELGHPATVQEATRLLDLSTLERLPSKPGRSTMATLTYRASGDVKTAYEFHRTKLNALKWKEVEGAQVTEQYASATFTRAGFHVSLTVMPASDAGQVDIMLTNHGNVNWSALPLPQGLKPTYVGPLTAMYTVEGAVPDIQQLTHKLLKDAGWVSYGNAADTFYFKKNAILLHVNVASAPAQGGKTMIRLGSEQLSSDLPAPANASDLRFTEPSSELTFQSPDSKDVVEKFYRAALESVGWKATLDKAIDISGKDVVIFRNPEKAMITVNLTAKGGGGTGVKVEYLSPGQFEEMDRHEREQIEKAKKKHQEEQNAPKPKVSLKLPTSANAKSSQPDRMTITLPAGSAKSTILALRTQLSTEGWTEELAVLEGLGGAVSFKKGALMMNLTYTDSGLSDAEITVAVPGAEVEVVK